MIPLALFTFGVVLVVFGLIFVPTVSPARQQFCASCVAVGFVIIGIIILYIVLIKLRGVTWPL